MRVEILPSPRYPLYTGFVSHFTGKKLTNIASACARMISKFEEEIRVDPKSDFDNLLPAGASSIIITHYFTLLLSSAALSTAFSTNIDRIHLKSRGHLGHTGVWPLKSPEESCDWGEEAIMFNTLETNSWGKHVWATSRMPYLKTGGNKAKSQFPHIHLSHPAVPIQAADPH